jgi:steroid delta-isomerase-like uncharacterized protein
MSDANKDLCRRALDVIVNQRNLAAAPDFIADDFVTHSPFPGEAPDREGFVRGYALFLQAFPDFRLTIEDLVAEGDKVALRLVGRGTHTGSLFGLPPTGKKVVIAGHDLLRVAGGKFVEHWGVGDMLGMLQQLGVVPGVGWRSG